MRLPPNHRHLIWISLEFDLDRILRISPKHRFIWNQLVMIQFRNNQIILDHLKEHSFFENEIG